MRYPLHTAEIVATSLLLLAFAALPAHGSSLGEVSAATGVHGTLARGGGSSSTGALKSVKSSLTKSTKPKDYGAGMGFGGGKSSGSKSSASRQSGPRMGGGGRGSWVSGSSVSRGSQSSAWALGGNGWGASGGGGRRAPARRPRS
jgi:hypothetical protein